MASISPQNGWRRTTVCFSPSLTPRKLISWRATCSFGPLLIGVFLNTILYGVSHFSLTQPGCAPDEDIQILLLQVRKLFLHHMISLTFVQIYRCSFIISRTRGTSGSLFAPSSYSYPALTTREASWIRYFVCHSALIGIFTFVTFSRCCTCSLSRPWTPVSTSCWFMSPL